MNKKSESNQNKKVQTFESVRVTSKGKEVVKALKEKAKKLNGKLNESDIVELALSLVTEPDLQKVIVQRRKGRDRKVILKEMWLKQNPQSQWMTLRISLSRRNGCSLSKKTGMKSLRGISL